PAVGRRLIGRFAEHLADAGQVQQLDVAQVLDALEDLEQLRTVETIASVAAHRRDQSDVLPQPERRGADAENPRRFADREQTDARARSAAPRRPMRITR